MTIYSWLILVHIFASSYVALGISIPNSCDVGEDTINIFGKFISNLTNEDSGEEANSHYSVFLPSRGEFSSSFVQIIESNQDVKNKWLKNHILSTTVEPGTQLSLSGLPITIIIDGDTFKANGYKLRLCSSSDDSAKISFYTIDGFLNDEPTSGFNQKVIFRNFRIPVLDEHQLKILEEYGSNFYKHWVANKDVLEDSSYDYHDLIILVPSDDNVSNLDQKQVIQLLASQIIPVNGGLPNLEDNALTKIHLKNLMGEDVALTVSQGNISINGIRAQDLTKVDQIYFLKYPTTLLVTDKITLENPAFNYDENELASAFVPPLGDDLVELFLQMQLHRFLSIWMEVQLSSQTQYAMAKENLCALPKKPGPCRLNLPRFYFDGENCRSFVYGGCEGNQNRFHSLRECTESCINDPVKKKETFQEICNLSFFQPVSSNFKCDIELRKIGFVKDEGHCRPIHVNSSHACFASESLFEDFETCTTYCESKDSDSLQPSSSNKIKPICHISKACGKISFNSLTKWVYDDHHDKCAPLKTKCEEFNRGFYDFEVECLKSCSINSKKVLTIFAPTDEAIESLPESIWKNNSIFHEELAKKFILTHFLREEAEIDRPTVYEDDKVRIVILHNIINMNEIKETSSFLRSSVGQDTFLPFNGLSQLRKEYLGKNNFVKYNNVYESIYKLMGVQLFNRVHQAISTVDAENRQFLHGRNATARGFCQQELSHGETNNILSKNTTRYYYNPRVGSCQSFQFSGVGGNSNNFHSYSECSDFCGKFEGLVGELNIISNKNIVGKALLIQPSPNQMLHLEVTMEGLEPDTLYKIEAGLTELMKFNSSTTGTVTINEQIDGVNLFGPLSVINNKIILRKLGKSSGDNEIVAHGSIVIVPNFLEARAQIVHEDSEFIQGEITLKQDGPFAPVSVFGSVDGIMEGLHGFHVHEIGSTANGCKGAGSHFNPHGKIHGGPNSEHRHVGDLGNVQVYWGSNLQVHLVDDVISLYSSSINSVMGRTIVIHEKKDDLGLAGDFSSLTTGNAGSRIACGIILMRNTSQTVGSSTRSNNSSLIKNQKGKTFFIPNDHVMSLIFNGMTLRITESIREFAFCHYSNQMFDFEAQESNYTTECGFVVHALKMNSSEKGYEIILNGVRAESVIRDGKNTFFVIPFFLYINDDAIKVENQHQMTFIPKSAFSELSPTDKQYGGAYHSTKQLVQLVQESPQSSLILSISLEPLPTSQVYVRLIENARIYPSCPQMNNDSFIDLGEIKLGNRNSKYRLSTDRSSLYGPKSIIGHVIVFFDERGVPLLCGRIIQGEFNDYSDYPIHDFWKRVSPLQLPPQDNELKARASELNMNLFFDAWDAALNNGIAVTTSKDENVTLVTLNDDNFQTLMPGIVNRSDHACNQDLFFQRKILGMMIIPGKINAESLREKEVIMPYTIEDSNLMFSLNEEGSIEIRNFKPILSESTSSTNLYLVTRSFFMNSDFLGPGDVFDSYDRSIYRIENPDW